MKTIKWQWRGRIMTDRFMFPWLQFSKHLDGGKHWSWEFHWKGSNAWYYNFRRYYDEISTHQFLRTRLTFRLGVHIIVFGATDMERYYSDVEVLQVMDKGKITYQSGRPETDDLTEIIKDAGEAIAKTQSDYWHLNKDYPNNSWRN